MVTEQPANFSINELYPHVEFMRLKSKILVFVHRWKCMGSCKQHPGSLNLHLVRGGCLKCHLVACQVLSFTPSVVIVNGFDEQLSRKPLKILHVMHAICLEAKLENPLDMDKTKTNGRLV